MRGVSCVLQTGDGVSLTSEKISGTIPDESLEQREATSSFKRRHRFLTFCSAFWRLRSTIS